MKNGTDKLNKYILIIRYKYYISLYYEFEKLHSSCIHRL